MDGFDFTEDFDIEITDSAFQKNYGLRWRHEYGGTIASRPCESEGIVYFGCDNYFFYALDSETGEEIWKFKSGGCAGNYPPVVVKNIVFFGSYDGFLYALDRKTGDLLWKFKTGDRVISGVAGKDGRIVFGSGDGNFYCLSLEGNEIWRFRTGEEVMSTPSIVDDMVYMGSYDCNMYCVNLKKGNEIWRFRTGGAVGSMCPVNVHENHIYFGSWDLNFYCLNRITGKEVWRFNVGQGILSGGVNHKGVIYFGSKFDSLHALDSKTGKELWRIKTDYHAHASNICIYRGNIYFGGGNDDYKRGLIACVSPEGKIIWKFITNGPSWVGPYINDGKLFAGSWNCYFYRLDPGTGEVLWKFRTGGSPSKEKVIDHSEVALITIVTGEGATVEGKKPGKYEPTPDIQIIENEYTTKSEYSSGGNEYRSGRSGYR